MKIHFHLNYATQFGENLFLQTEIHEGANIQAAEYPLSYLNDTLWHGVFEIKLPAGTELHYRYGWRNQSGAQKLEWGERRLQAADTDTPLLDVFDYWNPPGAVENTFETQAFRVLLPQVPAHNKSRESMAYTHVFRVKAPLLQADEVVCLLGHGIALRAWDMQAPLLLERDAYGWSIRLDLGKEDFPLAYKYGVWNTRSNAFLGFEDGGNRALYPPHTDKKGQTQVILHDGFARLPQPSWRGAGVAIPVFSLRSKNSFGVGEFTDLPALADWAKSVGLKLIQLLPINDTSAKHRWTDSYPYAAISAFALHPQYLNVAEVAGNAQADLLKPYAQEQKKLNALEAVDYEAVMQVKLAIIRQLFAAQKTAFLTDLAFIQYFTENQHWLVPYAAFCYLRDKNGSSDFTQWPAHGVYEEKAIEKLVSPKSAYYDEVAVHYFVQWHLHRQLKAAAEYAHEQGLVLKGDIPIGIYRYSCDAWVAPDLYNMDLQAGAPPDDFAVNGQNWGFPTYNWERMKADGFAWWRQRFHQMSLYFDAFRIDHILGFFRIWSIPMDAVEGILGYFVPAIPLREQEFHDAGIGFDHDRFCQPFINDAVLQGLFGNQAELVREHFLERTPDGGRWSGLSQYVFKSDFESQRKLEGYFNPTPNLPTEVRDRLSPKGEGDMPSTRSKLSKRKDKTTGALSLNDNLKQALIDLYSNVILIDITAEGAKEKSYAFRIDMENTASFRYLPNEIKDPLKALYLNYFFSRQDEFWQQEAMEKLPELKRATNMLICGEDLGMVPHCVPDVLRELGLLSLEIQRMPKASNAVFFHPKDAPYLSVVTPSTHDMSTLRGWWEEDRDLIQRFFNEVLHYEGAAPYFCEPWINRLLLDQHLRSPAMWAIFQLQDLLGMDSELRRENPEEERINVPANPKHYWRYRMHLSLETLQKAKTFNAALREMVLASGRG